MRRNGLQLVYLDCDSTIMLTQEERAGSKKGYIKSKGCNDVDKHIHRS